MKDFLEIPMSDLKGVTYTNPDRTPDALEWSFIKEISMCTGFLLARIHIHRAEKMKYSRKFDRFEFEYDGIEYVLEKGKLKNLA